MTAFTQWFPPTIPPERVGVYEAEWDSEHPEIDSGEWYNKWDGANWYLGDMSTRNAAKQKRLMPRTVKLLRWRGLTHNDRVEGRDAASSRRVPSHDGLAGKTVTTE